MPTKTGKKTGKTVKRRHTPRLHVEHEQSLLDLSSDWYWEQDEHYRFTRITGSAFDKTGFEARDYLGQARWDGGASPVGDGGSWDKHKAVLAARQPFTELVYKRADRRGALRYISSSGQPVFDGRGRFRGYRGVSKDVTQRIQTELRLRIEHGVTHILGEADSIAAAAPRIVQLVCETLGWVCGSRWEVNEQNNTLQPAEIWGSGSAQIEAFLAATERLPAQTSEGGGLVRATWAKGEPLWIPDVTGDPTFRRAPDAVRAGLRSAFAFPIKAGAQVTGVMEFFSHEIHQPDAELLNGSRYIGSQMGQFVQRKQAEEALREGEERFHKTFEYAPIGILHVDTDGRILRTNRHMAELLGYAHDELIGRSIREFAAPEDAEVTKEIVALRKRLYAGEIQSIAVERRFVRKDGSRLLAEMTISVLRDSSGKPLYDNTTVADAGVRKRTEQLLRLEHSVARRLSEADDVRAVLKAAIRAVCEAEGWDCGRYFRLDEKAGLLRFAEAWSVSGELMDRFIEKSRGLSYKPGVGLIGEVWQSGQPIWSEDLASDGRLSAGIAREIGMRGSFVFPVLSDGKTIGVLIFHSREIRRREERLLQTIGVIGNQIGQYVQRKQAEEVARENEARFRSLTNLSSDWFWEQDAEFRFTRFEGRHLSGDNSAFSAELGKTREEIGVEVEGGWEAHRALLAAHQPFRDVVMWRKSQDGRVYYMSISGEPIFDKENRCTGYRGVGKDITRRKRGEQLLALEHAVNRSLADADKASAALQAVIRTICETQGWTAGRYFRLDEEARMLRYEEAWSVPGANLEEFIARSREVTYVPGQGLAGKVWQSGKPLWVDDVAKDRRMTPHGISLGTGLRGTFLFPAVAEGKVVGVFTFISREVREPDERMLQAVRVVGSQVGQFVQRKQAEEVMRASEARFRSLTNLSSDLYWEQDEQYRFTTFIGFGSDRFRGGAAAYIGSHAWEQEYINMTEADWAAHRVVLDARQSFRDLELCRLDSSGTKRWISVSGEPIFSEDGRFLGYRGVGKDITERKHTEHATLRLGRMFAALSATNDAILHAESPEELYQLVCDAAVHGGQFSNTSIFLTEPGMSRLKTVASAGQVPEELRASHISIDETIPAGQGLVGVAFRTQQACISNDFLHDERTKPWHEIGRKAGCLSAAALPLIQGGRSVGAVLIHYDELNAFDDEIVRLLERMAQNVSFALDNFQHEAERRHAQERIQYLATHDGLTDLPNRVMFSQMLNLAIQSARRYDRHFAVLFLDLDRFKIINDTLGHEAGDTLLQEMARRLKEGLRSSDVVARLGGDEFVVLLQEVTEPEQVATVARKLLSTVIKPVVILGQECRVTASIGISMFPTDAQDEQSLMKNADVAMYLAKEEGKNNFQFYSREIKAQSLERLTLETSLRRALEREEFFLHYQAKLDLTTNGITGVEALLRWQHPDLGLVSPAQFIPLAEETGLIVPIGKWVLKTACAQNMAWQRAGLPPVCMAVNLSPRQFADENLLRDLASVLEETGMPPELLELEITESMVMGNVDRAAKQLAAIKQMGVRLAIDDFGTGYSSLAQIKRFPIDTIKVDRSFIREIPHDTEDKAITQAIIAMGKSLSLTVVAEGVETEAQQTFLREHACNEMQGYYFSKPVDAEQFADLLRGHEPKSSPAEQRA